MAAKKRGKKKSAPKKPVSSFALTPAKVQLAHPDPLKHKAIAAYLKHGTVSAACSAAVCGRSTWYQWLNQDELFARLVTEAQAHRKDALEQEAERRAITGSDTLLIFLLKAADPNKYRDKQIITEVSAEVRLRVQQTQQLIASRPQWESEELLTQLSEVWK